MSKVPGTSSHLRRGTIGYLGIGLVLFVAWQAYKGLRPPTCRLPDGTVVRLSRVSYQRPYRIITGQGLRHFLGPMIPERLAKALGCKYQTFGGHSNELSICMEVESATFKAMLPVSGTRASLHGASLFDASGWESGLITFYVPRSQSDLATIVFPFYPPPRNGEKLGVRLYGYQGRTNPVLAEFMFRNPMRK